MLSDKYSEASRRYHTPEHIDHCLNQFDAARSEIHDPDAVEMAIWFHDAIYEADAVKGGNELASAQLFLHHANGHFPNEFRDKVYRLVMVTTHSEVPQTNDERFMVDIDLSSFGLPWEQFSRDSANVRAEFPGVSDSVFSERQRCFLEGLLARESFCFTKFFRLRHEEAARANISRYLAKMSP